ncbi:hypothetical protein QWY28_14650 [Nocardioides sp. SOB77]|uniref:Uncharacterized protein n=1 Tax=Nocardioides oceani TaxID=3058369 RepID=A0ABT8FIA5_9ACTN|nr:hypothetical protein [Nocardioides oceani]MDN4174200.1 hypothetical protein [Nocardioides oceani]
MTTNYEQLDWSPTTWALLQGGMALMAVICMGLAVLLAFRASQATKPATTVTELPATPGTTGTESAAVRHATAA